MFVERPHVASHGLQILNFVGRVLFNAVFAHPFAAIRNITVLRALSFVQLNLVGVAHEGRLRLGQFLFLGPRGGLLQALR